MKKETPKVENDTTVKIIVTATEAEFFNSKFRGKFANSELNEAIILLRDWDKFLKEKGI